MPQLVHFDPFEPVLLDSPTLTITGEQDIYIKEILRLACSDSRFAEKAYNSIYRVLTGTPFVPAVITSIEPTTAIVGSPVALVVTGTGFTVSSVVVVAGIEQNTTYVSPTELQATFTSADTASVVPVHVEESGVASDPVDFTTTDIFTFAGTKKDFQTKAAELLKSEERVKDKKEPFIPVPKVEPPSKIEVGQEKK